MRATLRCGATSGEPLERPGKWRDRAGYWPTGCPACRSRALAMPLVPDPPQRSAGSDRFGPPGGIHLALEQQFRDAQRRRRVTGLRRRSSHFMASSRFGVGLSGATSISPSSRPPPVPLRSRLLIPGLGDGPVLGERPSAKAGSNMIPMTRFASASPWPSFAMTVPTPLPAPPHAAVRARRCDAAPRPVAASADRCPRGTGSVARSGRQASAPGWRRRPRRRTRTSATLANVG